MTDERGRLAGDALGTWLGRLTGDDPGAGRFRRGLVLGAIVGAAIAGSSILQRAPRGRRPRPGADPRAGGLHSAGEDLR